MARLDKREFSPATGDVPASADPLPEIATDRSPNSACPTAMRNAGIGPVRETVSPDEVLAAYCREVLLRQDGEAAIRARVFLESAGMNWPAVPDLPIGMLDSAKSAWEYAAKAGVSPGDWKKRRISPKLEGCLVGPIREFSGTIVTFWARATDLQSRWYLFRDRWDDRPIAFGMEQLMPSRPSHVFLVERILDALILRSWGVEPVLAFARRFDQVLPETWGELPKWGILQATLLPVGPEVPSSVLHGARDQARRSPLRPELWLIPPRRITPGLGRWASELGGSAILPWISEHRVPLLGRQSNVKPALAATPSPPAVDRAVIHGEDHADTPPQESADQVAIESPNDDTPSGGDRGPAPTPPTDRKICPKHGGPWDGCFCFD